MKWLRLSEDLQMPIGYESRGFAGTTGKEWEVDDMQDRYAGDVGDYGKIGLLKCLNKHEFDIGVNWYLVSTPDMEKNPDGTLKQNDGRYMIPESIQKCDPTLAKTLTKIAKSGNRSVFAIQKANLIPNAVYYDERLTVETRSEWHKKALERFKDCNLVFLDPDNGLLVQSVSKRCAKSIKYAFYEEVKDYLDAGKSVVVYNHRSRKPVTDYFGDIEDRLQERVRIYKYVVQEITFPKGTTRDYFAIPACEDHHFMIHDAFVDMLESKWGQLGVCKLCPEWPNYYLPDYLTYDEYIFVDFESQEFNDNSSFEEYKRDVVRYLTLCDYRYPEEIAVSRVDESIDYVREAFKNRESPSSLAIDIGYCCG